jgi:hypothetical protein
MNGLCQRCQQPVEVVDFRLAEGLVVVRCTACGTQQRLTLSEAGGTATAPPPPASTGSRAAPSAVATAAPSKVQPPAQHLAIPVVLTPPSGFCPKCVAPRSETAAACPACGLVYARAAANDVQPSAELVRAFTVLAGHWDDASAHVRFLHQAAESGELAAAGRLYRIRLALAPTDALARSSLDATVKMASAPVSVAAIRSAPEVSVLSGSRKKIILVAITFFGPTLAFALYRLWVRN